VTCTRHLPMADPPQQQILVFAVEEVPEKLLTNSGARFSCVTYLPTTRDTPRLSQPREELSSTGAGRGFAHHSRSRWPTRTMRRLFQASIPASVSEISATRSAMRFTSASGVVAVIGIGRISLFMNGCRAARFLTARADATADLEKEYHESCASDMTSVQHLLGECKRVGIFAPRPLHENDRIDFCRVDDRVFSVAAWMASRFLAAGWRVEFISTRGYDQGRPGNHLQYG
jgi:hypothetical protein